MDIIERKKHKDRVQKFLDGKDVIIMKYGDDKFFTADYETLKTYIEEQDLKNDYLEEKILNLEKELKNFKDIYETNRRFDIVSYI